MRIEYLFIGLVIFIISLTIANNLPAFFTFDSATEEALKICFLTLALGGLITGAVKGVTE